MTETRDTWLWRGKRILAAIGVFVLVGVWWLFRPEKLWINVKVNEPAPPGSTADAAPLYTGVLNAKAHPTSGRASVYHTSDGKFELRLTNFVTSNGPDVHIVLAQSTDPNLSRNFVTGELNDVEVAQMKANQGDQNYDLPNSVDLNKYDAVVIYCVRFHAVFGLAKLERF